MKTRHLLFMAATAVTLAACSGDEHENGAPTDAEGNLIAARFSAGIGEAVPVRASGATWDADGTDEIGITASENDAMAEKYKNVKYTVSSSGTLTGETIYFQDMNSVTFTAYYPFSGTSGTSAGSISHTITASDQTADNQPKIDYLFASAPSTTYASPSISLNFKHKMSKIAVTLTHDASISNDEFGTITEYTIGGLALEGTFDTADGTAAPKSGAAATDLTLGFSVTSAIVYPQTATDFTISLTMDGNTYHCSLGSVTFEAGNSYAYTVTVKRTGLEVGNAEINSWTSDNSKVEGTAEILYDINIEKHTITTYKVGVITTDMIATAMDNTGILKVVGPISNDDLKNIVAQSKSYTTLNMSEAKGDDLTLANKAFESCTSLTSISLPEGLTTLGEYAFYGCKALAEVTLHKGLTTIGTSAFQKCSALTSIDLSESSLTTTGSMAFADCSSLKSITLPASLTTIEEKAFRDCEALTSISLPKGLTTIGVNAFTRCKGLTGIDLSNSSLETIGIGAFASCTSLASIDLSNSSLTTIGNNVFQSCTSLTSINLYNTKLTTITASMLDNYTALETIILPASLETIGYNTFEQFPNLTSVTCYATTPPTCGDNAFYENYTSKKCTLYVPSSSVSAYKKAGEWKKIKTITAIQ